MYIYTCKGLCPRSHFWEASIPMHFREQIIYIFNQIFLTTKPPKRILQWKESLFCGKSEVLTSPNDSFSAPLGNLYPASVEESGRKRKKPEESIFLLIDGATSSTAHLCSDELYFQDFTICAFEREPRAKEPLEGKLQKIQLKLVDSLSSQLPLFPRYSRLQCVPSLHNISSPQKLK